MLNSAFIKKNQVVLVSLLFFLVNFLFKILYVSWNEIAMDEPFSIFYAQMDLPSIFAMLRSENNPALHFILLHFWIKLFGIGPFSVRLLSVLFSSLTAPVIYLTGKKFFSTRTGLIASLIFTFSMFHVYFSHEARAYSLFVFLTALSLYYFLSIVNMPGKQKPYVALFIVNLALIYSHYFGFFVLATEVVSMLFIPNFRQVRNKMVLVFIMLIIAYIPNIFVFIQRFSVSVEHGTWVRKPEITELYGNLNRFLNYRSVMMVLLAIIIVYTLLLLLKHQFFSKLSSFFNNSASRVLLVWFAFPYLGMFVISFWVPMFLDRYIIYISISFYLLIAVFLTKFTENDVVCFAASVVLLSVMAYNLRLAPDNDRRVGQVVEVIRDLKMKDPASFIIISPDYSYLEFTYHYNISYFKDYNNTLSLLAGDNIYPLSNFSSFDKTRLEGKKVIFLDCGTDFAFGKNPILAELKASHFLVKIVPVVGIYKIYWFWSKL